MLTNSPSPTMWRLEARKSFSLGTSFVDSVGKPLDITGCTISFVMASPQWLGGAVVVDQEFELVDPEIGVARLNLQSSDLDLAAGEYPITITVITSEGYSAAVLKGEVAVEENTESASTASTYDGAGWSTSITVAIGEQQQLRVAVSNFPAAGWSAFQLAQSSGFTGTVEEWLAGLEGPQGIQGVPGYDGVLVLEPGQTVADVPPGTPVGTIVYRKV